MMISASLYEANGGLAPWWFDTGLEWSKGVVYPRGIEQRFREYHLDRVFPSLSALTEASQRLQFEALKFEIENMRSHASLQGYVITELTDVHWESNGLLDMYRNPKIYYSQMKNLNAEDVLIPNRERWVYSAGESCNIKILVSHYSAAEIKEAVLKWEVLCDGLVGSSGQLPVGACPPFRITELGAVRFEAPDVERPTAARLELKLFSGERLIAFNELEFYVFPEHALSEEGQPLFSPQLRAPLEQMGYSITEDLSRAGMAIVTVLDDSLREFVLRGGRALLLAESDESLKMYIPGLKIEEREDTPWQGDWTSSFGWHRFDKLPTGRVVNFAFAGLTPEHVLLNFHPRDFAFDVYAGMFIGWLHKPVPTIARRRAGRGEVLVSTFRLSRNLETNPLARYLFAELMALLKFPGALPA